LWSVQYLNKALAPPITRQACGLDQKPTTAPKAAPQNQVRSPSRHFVIDDSSLHALFPELTGSSLLCITGATRLAESLFRCRARRDNLLRLVEMCSA
jgi:hypothetical protein